MDVEFVHHFDAVRLGSFGGYAQDQGDFFGGVPLGHELQDLALTIGQRIVGRLASRQVRLNDRTRHARAEIDAAGADFANGNDQMLHGLSFCHATLHAGAKRLQDVVLFRVHGEQNDFCTRRDPVNLSDRSDAVHDRHCQIEDRDIGLILLRQTNSLEAVGSFSHNLEVLAFEKHADALAYYGMIVCKNDCGHCQISSGISIVKSVPRSPLRPRRMMPPRAATRSRISVRPRPGRRLRNSSVLSNPIPSSRTEQTTFRSACRTRTSARFAPACFATLVSASWAIRYTLFSIAPGRSPFNATVTITGSPQRLEIPCASRASAAESPRSSRTGLRSSWDRFRRRFSISSRD